MQFETRLNQVPLEHGAEFIAGFHGRSSILKLGSTPERALSAASATSFSGLKLK
jgi:hypothetical protein